MATGPEHYYEAERLLKLVGPDWAHSAEATAEAQVHATLALAAAMGTFGIAEETRTAADANAWEYAAGEYSEQRRQARRDKAARVEHVDYDEAEAVREIEREMAIEAGDDSEIDRQDAEDDARNERRYKAHQANEAWLDAHPDEFVNDNDEDGAL